MHTATPGTPPAPPERVGVIGGGRMGSGIAHAFLLAGAHVTVAEYDAGAAAAARRHVMRALDASIARGAADEPAEAITARLSVTDTLTALGGCALVVEAVPEVAEAKHDVLARAAAVLDTGAVLASNTSSMSISALAAHVTHPERFLGLHFFNPVPSSQLVEVVAGSETGPAALAAAQSWVAALGKVAVTVTDSPGFASSRLGVLLGLEAIRMVEEGVAEPAEIDAAMTLGYKHPVGPLRLTDLVGLDVRLAIAEYLAGELGDRFAPPALLRAKVTRGELGRKSGHGFYRWDEKE